MTDVLRPPRLGRRKRVPTRSPRKDELDFFPGVIFKFPMLPAELSSFESFDQTKSPWLLAGSWPTRAANSVDVAGTRLAKVDANLGTGSKRSALDSHHPHGTRSKHGSSPAKKPRSSSVTSRSSPRIRPRSNSKRTGSPVITSAYGTRRGSHHPREATRSAAPDPIAPMTPDMTGSSMSDSSVDELLSLAEDAQSATTADLDGAAATPSTSPAPSKKLGRKCISCHNSNTPCWRPGWDNAISLCNSCGLR
ncbi:hypothetical protein H4R34_000614 [Dimargaris verticillata]|uniref:GATA-type domain-containing protein n=1 Tax=Dimargaris verticillata TaxID=2761393 RepID=A0A9W8BCC3_9FUNG|nr:hypothetical protein H4R34_000614 [Dimargaris verticillata]